MKAPPTAVVVVGVFVAWSRVFIHKNTATWKFVSQAQALRSGADAQNTQKSVSISSCVRDEGVCVCVSVCVCAYTMYITLAPRWTTPSSCPKKPYATTKRHTLPIIATKGTTTRTTKRRRKGKNEMRRALTFYSCDVDFSFVVVVIFFCAQATRLFAVAAPLLQSLMTFL